MACHGTGLANPDGRSPGEGAAEMKPNPTPCPEIAAIAIPLRSAYNPIYACRTRSSWSSDSPLPAITMRPFSST